MRRKMQVEVVQQSLPLKANQAIEWNVKKYLSSDRYFFDEFILIIIVSEYFKRGQSFYSQKNLWSLV